MTQDQKNVTMSDDQQYRFNNACGERALSSNLGGSYNVAIGSYALQENTLGSHNTAAGFQALPDNTTGFQNVALGSMSMLCNTTGFANCATGTSALRSNIEGHLNAAYGEAALGNNATGNCNVAIGASSLVQNITGDYNIACGYNAGSSPWTDGITNNSIFIGGETGSPDLNYIRNQIVIGHEAIGKGSNTIVLGNGDIERLYCKATAITELSDARVREEIEPADLDLCCQAVRDLPVTRYKYKDCMGKYNDTHRTGFLADDVEKVFPKSVTTRDAYVPELDAQGKPIFEEIARPLAATAQSGPAKTVAREVKHQVKKLRRIENVKDITMTEAVPTLWGAVQALLRRVDDLEAQLAQKH